MQCFCCLNCSNNLVKVTFILSRKRHLHVQCVCLCVTEWLNDNHCIHFNHSALSSHNSPSALWELSALNGSYSLFISVPAELCFFPGLLSLNCSNTSQQFCGLSVKERKLESVDLLINRDLFLSVSFCSILVCTVFLSCVVFTAHVGSNVSLWGLKTKQTMNGNVLLFWDVQPHHWNRFKPCGSICVLCMDSWPYYNILPSIYSQR